MKEKTELSSRLKFAESRVLETQVRSGSISREKSDKIKFLETKVKELIKSPEKTDPKSLLFKVRQLEEENKNLKQELYQLRGQFESQELKLPLDMIDQTHYIEQLKSRVLELESAAETFLQEKGMICSRPLSRNSSNKSFKPPLLESIKIQTPIKRTSVVYHHNETVGTPRSVITIYHHTKQKINGTFESIMENFEDSKESLSFIPFANELIPPPPLPPPPPPPPLPSLTFFLNGQLMLPNLNELNTSNEPKKEKKKPKVPMKQICWNPITKRDVKGTIWETIKDEEVIYDPLELEKLFTSKRLLAEKTKSVLLLY